MSTIESAAMEAGPRAAGRERKGAPSPARSRICMALLVLIAFTLGCSEFVVIGIESDLADAFHVSLQATGRLISLFSLPYAILTPILALTTGRFRRRQLLICYCALFVAGNLVSAFATSFPMLIASRMLLGSVSGALLAVVVTYIPELVSARHASLMLSLVYAAYSVAMILVTSIGKIVADTIGWRWAMYGTLALAAAICGAAVALLPRAGATDAPATFREQSGLLKEPAVISAILIFVFGVGSVYTFYGYVTPYLEQVLGMGTMQASGVLLAFGGFALVSNLLGGWIDSRFGVRALDVTFALQGLSLLAIWLAGPSDAALAAIFCVALLMYLASVPCVSLFMRVSNERHPKALTLASSLEPMAFNMGIAFGTAIGGAVVAGPGIASTGLVGAALSVVALGLSELTWRLSQR